MEPRLLNILVCPVSKGSLRYDRAAQELVCEASRLAYPVRDGVPVMLESAARKWSDSTADIVAASAATPASHP